MMKEDKVHNDYFLNFLIKGYYFSEETLKFDDSSLP